MSRTKKQIIGQLGEDIAVRYLEDKGFSVRERNYSKKWGEIDIICERDEFLYFIEVKTVKKQPGSKPYLRPEEHVDRGKIRRLERAITTYMSERGMPAEYPWQLDLVAVELDVETRRAKIRYYENIYL